MVFSAHLPLEDRKHAALAAQRALDRLSCVSLVYDASLMTGEKLINIEIKPS